MSGAWVKQPDGEYAFDGKYLDPERKIATWAEAEEVYPGCSAEWDQICIQGAGPWCPTPKSDVGYNIYIRTYASTGQRSVEVVLDDPKREWYWPPMWVRSQHSWHSPLPMPMALMRSMETWLRDDHEKIKEHDLGIKGGIYTAMVSEQVGNLGQEPPEPGSCPNCGAPHVGLGHLDRRHGSGLWTGCPDYRER